MGKIKMILLLDVKKQKMVLYTDSGKKEIPFANSNLLKKYVVTRNFLIKLWEANIEIKRNK